MIGEINYSVFSKTPKKMNFGANPISQKQNSKENSVQVPEVSPCRIITEEEITDFHENLAKTGCKDKLLYYLYTTPKDVGSGCYVLALPPTLAADDKAKNEMAKEIKRLCSDSSTLSSDEKFYLKNTYSKGIYSAPRNYMHEQPVKTGLIVDFDA